MIPNNTQTTPKQHPNNTQTTPKQHPNNTQTTLKQHPYNTQTTPKQHPNNTQHQTNTPSLSKSCVELPSKIHIKVSNILSQNVLKGHQSNLPGESVSDDGEEEDMDEVENHNNHATHRHSHTHACRCRFNYLLVKTIEGLMIMIIV